MEKFIKYVFLIRIQRRTFQKEIYEKKMEFRKIEPGVWKAENEGDEIVGKLVKVGESSKYKDGGKVYHLEVTDEESGKVENQVVFGTAVLDDRMSFVEVGQIVKIQFVKTEKNKKGQDMKIFEVSVGTPEKEE